MKLGSLVCVFGCFAAVSQIFAGPSSVEVLTGEMNAQEEKKIRLSLLLGGDLPSASATQQTLNGVGAAFGARLGYRISPIWEVGLSGSYSKVLGGSMVRGGSYSDAFGVHTITDGSASLMLITAEGGVHPTGALDHLFVGVRMGVGILSASSTIETSSNRFGNSVSYPSGTDTAFAVGPVVSYQFDISDRFSIEPRVSYLFLTVHSATSFSGVAAMNYHF